MTDIPKVVDHVHTQSTWTDDEILAHVQEQHNLNDQPWMLNESNRVELIRAHERAHYGDPISVDWMP